MSMDAQVDVGIETQARLLCTRIDSEIRKPAVILVTAAESGDGSSYAAETLAKAFAKFGRRTALFDATREGRGLYQSSVPGQAEYVSDQPTVVWMRTLERLSSREALGEFVSSLRSAYDITIIDAPPVMESSGSMALGDVADATVVALRHGRNAGEGDEITAQMLHACKSQFLGVVITDAHAVARHEDEKTIDRMPSGHNHELALAPTPIRVKNERQEGPIGVIASALLFVVCGIYSSLAL